MTTEDLHVEVWRLHPRGARVEPASATLAGEAPLPARQYCGPFTAANGAGVYLYSPVDIDVTYDPRQEPAWTTVSRGQPYSDDECDLLRAMPNRHLGVPDDMIRPRTKMFFAPQNYEPRHTLQIWTGCIFRTPPGWALWMRGPINRELGRPFQIMDAVLETDWLWYDIWMNLRFTHVGQTAELRRAGGPLAQLVPVHRQTTQRCHVVERAMSQAEPGAQEVFDRWASYQCEKFHSNQGGEVNHAVYQQMRRACSPRASGGNGQSDP